MSATAEKIETKAVRQVSVNGYIDAITNNRTRQVHLDTLDALCRALKCEPGELLERKRGRG